ncbi:MAG: hypothetical protein WBZ48_12015 [Bacteroidota bacterium]
METTEKVTNEVGGQVFENRSARVEEMYAENIHGLELNEKTSFEDAQKRFYALALEFIFLSD